MIDAHGLRLRASALSAIRRFLEGRGYLEVPTPVLVPSGAFEEHLHVVRAADGALRTSPEFALKRALAAGLGRIYEIGPCLRDRESGPWHGREFTMLEWYRVGAEPDDVMDEVEALVAAVATAMGLPPPGPWKRLTLREAFLAHAGIDLAETDAAGLSKGRDADWDDAFIRAFVEDVEPHLSGPTFLLDWPVGQAALSRVHDGPWPVARRFEAFLGRVELANAFFELNDPTALLQRAASSAATRAAAGDAPHPVDRDLVRATAALPRTTGIALGVDRLVAALAGWPNLSPGRVEATWN